MKTGCYNNPSRLVQIQPRNSHSSSAYFIILWMHAIVSIKMHVSQLSKSLKKVTFGKICQCYKTIGAWLACICCVMEALGKFPNASTRGAGGAF